jgi:DNA-binding MarR family transcriptional regulator
LTSMPLSKIPSATAALLQEGPYVGAFLRVAYQTTRKRSFKLLEDRGFTDLNQALLSVFTFPPPEGARPTDLAKRTSTTKQAMNYLLSQLESLGYMERHGDENGARRSVYLTRRGWLVFDAIWTAQRQIEKEWAALLGKRRFDEFMSALRQLSGTTWKDDVKDPSRLSGRGSTSKLVRRTSRAGRTRRKKLPIASV